LLAVLDNHLASMVVELPPGLLMGTANDMNQRCVLDIGLPGPDRGRATAGSRRLVVLTRFDSSSQRGAA
jgi:hypothetical protein